MTKFGKLLPKYELFSNLGTNTHTHTHTHTHDLDSSIIPTLVSNDAWKLASQNNTKKKMNDKLEYYAYCNVQKLP